MFSYSDVLIFRPNPSIDEIETATHDFCALEWSMVKETMIGKDKKHPFTKSSQLHNRCVEALYMATLLEYGFGFDGTHKNITLALEVMGHEVEWTLGFALAEVPLPPSDVVEVEYSYGIKPALESVQISLKNLALQLQNVLHNILEGVLSFLNLRVGREL